jgi:hypothetical protein
LAAAWRTHATADAGPRRRGDRVMRPRRDLPKSRPMDCDISVGLFSLSMSLPVPLAGQLFRRQLTCPILPIAFRGQRDTGPLSGG